MPVQIGYVRLPPIPEAMGKPGGTVSGSLISLSIRQRQNQLRCSRQSSKRPDEIDAIIAREIAVEALTIERARRGRLACRA
jgi:hypothetical protein